MTTGSATTQSTKEKVEAPSTSQEGFGIDPDLVSKIATLVARQLQQRQDHFNQTANEPIPEARTTFGAEVVPGHTLPPLKFDTQVEANILHDTIDEKLLLTKVPKGFHDKARHLIQSISELSNEITYDNTGTVFINQSSIPGSNFYKIFPKLFAKSAPKNLKGFLEVSNKLKSLGLIHLTSNPNQPGKGSVQSDQWWYIGE